MNVNYHGDFSGVLGSGMKNAPIPPLSIPENFREPLFTCHLPQPVSSLDDLITNSDDGTVQVPWVADVTALLSMQIYQDMNCLRAWKVIPVNVLVGIIDMNRNMVLSFVLEIESEAPEARHAPINSQPIAEERVNQIFNTYITGNIQNVATGSTNINQHAVKKKIPNFSTNCFKL